MPNVLCVDEDTYLTHILSDALSREGYSVQIANTGVAALQLARATLPDIAMLDLSLPDIDGYTLLTQFRSALRIPVIIVSSRQGEEDVAQGLGQGADDYVIKPFSMKVLVQRLNAVLRSRGRSPLAARSSASVFRIGSST